MNSHDIGDVVRISGTFRDFASALTDPTTVALVYRKGDGTTGTVTWAAAQVVRDSPGVFHYDLPVDVSGIWHYRWETTGTVQAAEPGAFSVVDNEVETAVTGPRLITVAQAKRHIRLDGNDDDIDVAEKVVEASAIVLNYLKVDDTMWQDSAGAPLDVPGTVQAATKIVFANLYAYREGGSETASRSIEPLSDTVKNLLMRYRDPAIA